MSASGIGVYKESPLHESLKLSYAEVDGQVECPVGNYVCDAVRADGLLVEVQTGSFGPIREKISTLCREGRVRLVHPIPRERWIELRDASDNPVSSRKSPKKGTAWELFKVLVYAPELPLLPNLSIEIAYTREKDHRKDDGKGSWRRKGVSRTGRELVAILDSEIFDSREAWLRFIPSTLAEPFTVTEFSKAAHVRRPLASKAIYVLTRIGILSCAGTKARAKLYTVAVSGQRGELRRG